MNEYKLSFCIPVYNCAEGAEKLVKQLLSIDNMGFQVVVIDDCSTDKTYSTLSTIKDSRLKFIENEKNLGPKQNWYKALLCGDGEWLYLVMGRDKLNAKCISNLITILDNLKNTNISYLKDLDQEAININNKLDEINNFIVFGDHPTGAIYRREDLHNLGNKEDYFTTDFTYPEILLAKDIIKTKKAKYINSGVFIYKVNIDKEKVKSNFEKDNKVKFYYPERRIDQCLVILDAQKELVNYHNLVERFPLLIINQYKRLLQSVTIDWIFFNKNAEWAHHYNKETRNVHIFEIIKNEKGTYKTICNEYSDYINCKTKFKMTSYNFLYFIKSIKHIILD